MATAVYRLVQFTDSDVVNGDHFIPRGEFNPHNVRPWLLHDHGFTLAVVFADCLQDALDIAADAGALDRYQVTQEDQADYPDDEALTFLGNACGPFDIDTLGVHELPIPQGSFCAQYAADYPHTQATAEAE